jgi:hypothetical protein
MLEMQKVKQYIVFINNKVLLRVQVSFLHTIRYQFLLSSRERILCSIYSKEPFLGSLILKDGPSDPKLIPNIPNIPTYLENESILRLLSSNTIEKI